MYTTKRAIQSLTFKHLLRLKYVIDDSKIKPYPIYIYIYIYTYRSCPVFIIIFFPVNICIYIQYMNIVTTVRQCINGMKTKGDGALCYEGRQPNDYNDISSIRL